MNYYWNWRFFFERADDGYFYIEWVLLGCKWTVIVSLGAMFISFFWGSTVGVARTWPENKLVNRLGDLFVEVFRNIPLIVQLFIWFYVVPELVPERISMWMKQEMHPVILGVVGLGLFSAARVAEQMKAGLQAVPVGQKQAALALGFTMWQTYFYVLMPRAYRIIFPALTSEAMNLFKNSSITFAVGVLEMYFQYKQIIEKTSQIFEITLVITGIYIFLAFCINRVMAAIEKRLRVPGFMQQVK